MVFEGCNCAGCGDSKYEGLSTPVQRPDGYWVLLTVCCGCLFKAAIGEEKWAKAIGSQPPKKKKEELNLPIPLKPKRFLGLI